MRRSIRTVWVNSTGYLLQLCKIGIFWPICLLSLHPSCFWCWTIPNHILKNHDVDAELAGHVGLTWSGSVCVGVPFLCLMCACWLTNNTAKTKMGYISLPSHLNAIIGIKSYYCVILKMMILHDAIKTIQNRVLVIFLKKQKYDSFQKTRI